MYIWKDKTTGDKAVRIYLKFGVNSRVQVEVFTKDTKDKDFPILLLNFIQFASQGNPV